MDLARQARRLGPATWDAITIIGGIDFSKYDNNALYNVLDDIPFQFLPCKKQLLGAQSEYVVNEKYCKKKKLNGEYPVLYCATPISHMKLQYKETPNTWIGCNKM